MYNNLSWEKVKIGDIVESISENNTNKDKPVVLINTSDILNGKVLNHEKVSNENLKGQFKKSFKQNDILFSEIRPINGRNALITFDSDNYIASTKLMVLRAKHRDLNIKYFYYLLTSKGTLEYLQAMAESRSGTFPQITFSTLADIEIHLPPLNEQNQIVKILSSFDNKIENNNAIIANLEEQARAIFKTWFIDFEPFQDKEFIDSELGLIPEGWEIKNLEEVAESILRGFNSKYVESSNLINLNQKVNRGDYLDKKHFKYLDESIIIPEDKYAKKYDIFINSLGKGTLGRIHLYMEKTNNVVLDQHITIVRGKNTKSAFYLYYLLTSDLYSTIINGLITGSTGMLMLNIGKIRKIPTLVPDGKSLEEFRKRIQPMKEYSALLNAQNERLIEVRDTLLPKLMSGEIRVEEAVEVE